MLRPVTRASTGVLHPAGASLAPAARAEVFALGILRRHSSDYAGVAPVEAVLRARPDATVTSVFQMMNTLALRIDLVSHRSSTQHAVGAGGQSHSSANVTPRGARRERTATVPGRAILERLFAREHRIETVFQPESTAPPSTLHPEHRGAPPEVAVPDRGSSSVEMVLRREAVSARPAAAPSRSARQTAAIARRPTGPVTASTASFAPQTAPLSGSELVRITDEVVRVIDRRIIAQRERRGVI